MRVICKTNKGCDLSQRTLSAMVYESTVCSELKIGSEHTVYAISLYKGVVHYLLGDDDFSSWYPAEFFQVIDKLMYKEWYFEFYGDFDGLIALWGYKELLDLNHYSNLIEMESEDLAIFAKRKQEMDKYEALGSKRLEFLQMRYLSEYPDEPVEPKKYIDTLQVFLEKYLKGQIGDQQFTWRYKFPYEQLINYKKLTPQEETIMKDFRTVVENYAPDHINPKRVYSNEEEVRAAAQKALECVKANPYLASLTRES